MAKGFQARAATHLCTFVLGVRGEQKEDLSQKRTTAKDPNLMGGHGGVCLKYLRWVDSFLLRASNRALVRTVIQWEWALLCRSAGPTRGLVGRFRFLELELVQAVEATCPRIGREDNIGNSQETHL